MLAGVLVAVLFAAIATGGEVKLAERAPSFVRDPTPNDTVAQTAPVITETVESDRREPFELPAYVEAIAEGFFFVCLAAFAVIVLAFAWRHRPTFQLRRRRPSSVEFDALDDVVGVITADAAAQRSALQRGAPRNAIVECWLLLEAAVVDAGVPREPSDTSAEFTQRVLATVSVDRAAISVLAALYREARFSNHPMNEESRRVAIEALDAVHQGLRSGRRTVVESP